MKPVWTYILFAVLGLAGCDVGDRNAAAAMNKANAEAAKQCEAKLKGLKHVPIVGTGGKLFLVAERLPSWAINREFRVGDECGASAIATETEMFYWTGKKTIPQSVWLKAGHSLTERPGPQDWFPLGAQIYFGLPKNCNGNPDGCEALKDQPWNVPDKIIRLKKYPIDAVPAPNPKHGYSFALREWPMDSGRPRMLRCGVSGGKSDSEIENLNFEGKPLACGLDFYAFSFKAGTARIAFSSNEFTRITPALRALHQYLNDSIIEEK